MTDFSLVPFAFSDHCLNSFLQSTESSHSDLPQPNQQPMHRTKSLTGICSFSIIISLHHNREEKICCCFSFGHCK